MHGIIDTFLLYTFVSYVYLFINVFYRGCEKGVEEHAG